MAFVISACFCCIFRLKSLMFIIFLRVLIGDRGNNANFAAKSWLVHSYRRR